MKRLLFAAAFFLSAPAFGASLGYQQSTSLSATSAINLPSIPQAAGSVLLSVETQAVRYRDDGTDPTATVGQPVATGQTLCYANDAHAVRIISQTAGATINLTYYSGKSC